MPIEALSVVTLGFAIAGVVLAAAIIFRIARLDPTSEGQRVGAAIVGLERTLRGEFSRGRQEDATGSKLLREEVIGNFGSLADGVRKAMADLAAGQKLQLDGFAERLTESRSEASANARALREEVQQTLRHIGDRLAAAVGELSQKSQSEQEALRKAVEGRLDALRSENGQKLEQMRQTVDEKLQGTLEQRLGA